MNNDTENAATNLSSAKAESLSSATAESPSSAKAESNRRNARKSTGPKTARGKSWSRRNALKHGILASQAVIATSEGRAERTAFEQLVEGLALDFAPVGSFEQVLVQQIAACIWRQRRLLMFENRAAFKSRDTRTFRAMNEPNYILQPQYELAGRRLDGEDILEAAGLGLDLPSEADTMRLIRYEGSITRSLKTALAQLKAMQQARRAAGETSGSKKDRTVIVDDDASRRNRGPAARHMSAKAASRVIVGELRREDAERARRQASDEEAKRAGGAQGSENYQTKPNMPQDPEALRKHQRLIETAETVIKLGASLAPRRGPGED